MIVVDTSTIIKGFIAHYREPKFIVDKIVDGTFRLAMTEEMAKELQMAVLATAITYGKSPKPFLRHVASFIYHAKNVPSLTNFTSCADSEDSMFIECAIDGQVDFVISSDRAIYQIKEYSKNNKELELIKNIQFFNPEEFYKAYHKKKITL